MSKANKIAIYDTTLRDGTQGEGISFSLQDKLLVASALDKFGVDYIEGGWPGSNPKDMEFFIEAKGLKFKCARLAAFGSTRHAKNSPSTDPNLQKLAACGAPVLTIFGKTWDLHVREALRVPQETNLKMIASSIKYLSQKADAVFFDAEHFFDGFRENREYALQTLTAAAENGAKALILCDTNGGSLPGFIAEVTSEIVRTFPGIEIGIHGHNDCGLAVANEIAAVQAGARQIQGTINGLGERAGNADLTQIIPILNLKLGLPCLDAKRLAHLTDTSRYIYEIANLLPRDNQPFVGRSAFAHKGGIHVSAVQRNARTYEQITPESVGNARRVLISELSGRSNLKAQAGNEFDDNPELMQKTLQRIMELENDGYAFEAADASFTLLVRQTAGTYQPFFELESYRVTSEVKHGKDTVSEATVKVRVGEKRYHTVDEGEHGPVDALSNALLKALATDYPDVEALRLVDYKVHILNSRAATSAKVRVIVQSRAIDSEKLWGTIGVSENIIEASCHALVDSINFHLLRQGSNRSKGAKKCSK